MSLDDTPSQEAPIILVVAIRHAAEYHCDLPAALQEHRHVTSFVSTLLHVVGDALVDRDKQSITIFSCVSALASVVSGKQDHVSSGALALTQVSGAVGGA